MLPLLLPLLFSSVLSSRPATQADVQLNVSSNAKCALFCHLPPPFHPWRDVLEVCDPATSLFIDHDKSILRNLEPEYLSGKDLVDIAHYLTFTHGGSSEEDIRIATGYQSLKSDMDVAQGVLFGEVVDLNESNTQGRLVTTKWTPQGDEDETRCITFLALDEVASLCMGTRSPDADKYKTRRMKCLDIESGPPSLEQVEQARVQVEECLPRTKMIRSHGGREALVAKLVAALPPAAESCGSPEDCLESQFVSITTWHPPKHLAHSYDNVIFVGCNYRAFEGIAVESALMLVGPGGKIMVSGFTMGELEELHGMTPFSKLSGKWDLTLFPDPRGRGGLTVFSQHS